MQVAVGKENETAIQVPRIAARFFLADKWVFILGFGFQNNEGEAFIVKKKEVDKTLVDFLEIMPEIVEILFFILTPGSRQIFAALVPSEKNRQPAASSNLLILIRAVASFEIIFLHFLIFA